MRGVRRSCGVEDYRDPRYTWCDILQQLEPLPHQRRVQRAETGDVAARPSESLNQAQPDGIGHEYENDYHQPEDRQGPRPHPAAEYSRPGRRGDRVATAAECPPWPSAWRMLARLG